jgi:6-phosphogluconate dehydrogenase
VKVVHNGIEYGLMQLISETYHLMKRLLGLNDDELHNVFYEWNQGELESFLLEITHQIFRYVDEKTGLRLIDEILDKAKQKGECHDKPKKSIYLFHHHTPLADCRRYFTHIDLCH